MTVIISPPSGSYIKFYQQHDQETKTKKKEKESSNN